MQLWTVWLDALREVLQFFSSGIGLGAGLAILTVTILLRLALLPVSWSCAYRSCIHQKRVKKIQPMLTQLRRLYKDKPAMLAEKSMSLYRKNGLTPFEMRPILGALVQMPVFLGMFQVLRTGVEAGRFLWIASLSRPDAWIALIAGITTAMMVAANPDLPESARMIMIIVPSALATIFAFKFASALALYWIASNSFTALQTLAIHSFVDRRIRSGAITI